MRLVLLLASVLLTAAPARGQDAFTYRDALLRTVIEEVQEATGYRFLYRDAVVAGERVSLRADTVGVLDALARALRPRRLAMQVDRARKQVLLYVDKEARAGAAVLRGQVVDAGSGAPLPFATVSWREQGRLAGTTTGQEGLYRIVLPEIQRDAGELDLTVSYVGYEPAHVRIDVGQMPSELTVRLRASVVAASEVVVTGSGLHTYLDTSFHRLMQPGLFATLGEPSVMRSLQPLPAVTLTGTMGRGLSVRGSKADGFQVLLDGIPIYNQQHLFGLFDAFNASALQTVAFYYDVAPATYFAPPGGTLAYVTRAGSQTALHGEAGATNTAAHVTLEGPLPAARGSGSWLVSGRHSYLNTVDWLGSADLISQGLNVGEAASRPGTLADDERVFFPETPTARFYDVHARGYYETPGGTQWSATTYAGGDEARQDGERLMQVQSQGQRVALSRVPVTTLSRWGNEAAGLRLLRPLRPRLFLHSLLAATRYHSRYRKDDFVYTRRQQQGPGRRAVLQSVIHPFLNENELREGKWEQRLDWAPPAPGVWALGYAWHYVDVTYAEESVVRTGYRQRTTSHQVDLFAQYDLMRPAALDVHLGLRTHYFSQGGYLRLSPRVRVTLLPQRPLSVGLGYSRNHQFLHRLSLRTTTSADVWLVTTPGQPPSSVDHLTGGLYARPMPSVLLQVEGYLKTSRNLRQHEIDTPTGDTPALVRYEPWFWDNTAYARGLEVLYRQRRGVLEWTMAYALSKVELQNDAIAAGARYRADWDRRHQLTTTLEASLHSAWTASLAWLFASGAPNDLAQVLATEPERLAPYHRLDASLRYRRTLGGAALELSASVFNLYDRDNPWYRMPVAVVEADQRPRRLTFVPVDIYDLGLQPSFAVSVRY